MECRGEAVESNKPEQKRRKTKIEEGGRLSVTNPRLFGPNGRVMCCPAYNIDKREGRLPPWWRPRREMERDDMGHMGTWAWNGTKLDEE